MAISRAELEMVNAVFGGRNARELEKAADEMYEDGEDAIDVDAIVEVRRLVKYMLGRAMGAKRGNKSEREAQKRTFDRHNR